MLPNLFRFNLWGILSIDFFLVTIAYYGAYLIRFDGAIEPEQMRIFWATVFWIVPLFIITFAVFRLYSGMWRYTSITDSLDLLKAVVIASSFAIVIILMFNRFDGCSRSVFIINGLLIFLLTGGFRICIRFLFSLPIRYDLLPPRNKFFRSKNLLIVGAGSAGEKLIRELRENKGLAYQIVGLIDDNPQKHNLRLHGVLVLGSLDKLGDLVGKYEVEEIAIAIPSASIRQMRRIIEACKKTPAKYKTLPSMGDIIQGNVTFSQLREVRYEDLLKRAPIDLDNDSICQYLTDKRVLVTGGAGSIGSELCRQIAAFSPNELIILERNESGLHELMLDIKAAFPELNVIPALAAVQNQERMTHIFSCHMPQVVFHAAAYKHVPMMEIHPWEAIFNNVVGSRMVLQHCHRFDVQCCVMVSTDKAVRPTNVMGATKRLVELLTQSYAAMNHTRYMAVRFGNVLGSVGSVLPLFKKQIAVGGPVTVTDPNMTRYFMTIPEACSLILQSGAFGREGEIFVLKMGTPVRIDDMARDLISLSGFQPGEDIEIRYTGLRPGEKLYEELITQGEGIQKTQHEDIMVLSVDGSDVGKDLETHVDELIALAHQGDGGGIKRKLNEIIPEYRPWKDGGTLTSGVNTAQSVLPTGRHSVEAFSSTKAGSCLPLVAVQDRLLLQVLSMTGEKSSRIPFEALPIPDWEKLIQSALKHQVAPLLYLQLKRAKMCERLPLKIDERLRKIYLYSAKTGMRQQYWLGKILHLLMERDLQVLVFNGLHIGENIYHNIAAKPVSDMNLFLSAGSMLCKRPIQKQIDQYMQNSGMDIHISVKIHYPGFEQELHPCSIWQRAQSAEVAGCKVMVPCPEDLLLHLCIKFVCFYQYKFAGIQTLCDIREILHQHGATLDWNIVRNESGKLAMANAVGLTLILAKDLLHAPVAAKAVQMFVSEAQLSFVKRFALQYIFDEKYSHKTLPPHCLELWESESLFNKARALQKLIFTRPLTVTKKPVYQSNTYRFIHAYKREITCTLGNCAQAVAMLLAKDRQSMDQLRKQQQNTLIWEWIYGKRQFSEKINTTPEA
ncbi:MAG: polysaccharide biosynthesis protein [Desulfobacteraceae bacterium]